MAHDRFGTTWTLAVDALSVVACGVIAFSFCEKSRAGRARLFSLD
jgi:hypothetical protein